MVATFVAAFPLSVLQAAYNPESGTPVFQYYSPDQYNASPQNWAITQDRRGVMYFGNTDGVLEFDGVSWRIIKLKNGSIARSVATDDHGTVFVGGQGDFGFLRPDRTGQLRFVSLLETIPVEDRKFTDVWRILQTPAGVYFSAYERLFRLNKDGSIKVWRPATNFGRAFYVLDGLYVKSPQQGLLKMEADKLMPIAGGAMFAKIGITDAISLDENALIATPTGLFRLDRAGGVQRFATRADTWFASNLLYTIRQLPSGEIAAGSRQGGVVLLNPNGTVDRTLTKSSGLADDYVASIFTDEQGGIWLAGFNGLTRFYSGLSNFTATLGLEGNAQCVARQGGHIYAGTAGGLFRMESIPGQSPRFERVAGIKDGVLTLTRWGTDLLAATENGVFQITGKQATRIFTAHPDFWWEVQVSLRDPTAVYVTGQAGVFMLRHQRNSWVVAEKFVPPAQEFRTVLEDADGKVWATTRDAIWRIDFREPTVRFEKFGAAEGVPVVPGGWINAHRLKDHVTFATSKGLRRYSDDLKRFTADLSLGSEFADGSRDVFHIAGDPAGNVWVTGEKYHGVLLNQAAGYKWYSMPLQAAGIKEIYEMSLDEDQVIWIAGAKGVLYRWDRGVFGNPDNNFRALPRLIRVNQKETLYGGAGEFDSPRLPWADNNLHFEFAAPFYEDPLAVEYQTQLEGSDREWSPWSHQTWRDYTNLPEGAHQFRIRARTPHGTLDEPPAISFGVLPPWYRTWWAYGIYLICGGLGVWAIVRLRTRQLKEDNRRLELTVEERTVEIRHQRDEIQAQERKANGLLLNILPATVADELKSTGSVKPVDFDDVTVCFTDFVGFTLSSETMPAGILVGSLNEYFTAFDEIAVRHGLEKLKTIGDSYMFASGLPAPRRSHAVDAVLAALEMVEFVKQLAARVDGPGWNIRVGLHSGPVVAGVVGTQKFAFDIWGTTVNFAARMESSGVRGHVNMSERTYGLVAELIDCEARGRIKIKEGRELPMFLALGPVPDFAERYREQYGQECRAHIAVAR